MNDLGFDPLLIAIAAPLALALAIALGLPKRWAMKLGYLAFAVPALCALLAWATFAGAAKERHGYAFMTAYSTGLDHFGIALKLGLNGISLPLFVLAGVVGLAAGFYALQSKAERMKTYLLLLLVMQAGLMGTFASVNIFFFYFFHELALIATFIMIGIWGGRDRNYAAMMMTIYLTLGAMLSLLGLVAIYVSSGADSFDLTVLRDTLASASLGAVLQKHIFGLLLFGFGILVSLWPFHSWPPSGTARRRARRLCFTPACSRSSASTAWCRSLFRCFPSAPPSGGRPWPRWRRSETSLSSAWSPSPNAT